MPSRRIAMSFTGALLAEEGSALEVRASDTFQPSSRPTLQKESYSRLVFNEDERVASWVQERMPNFLGWNGHYRAVGYELCSRLAGGVVYTQYSGANIVVATVLQAPLTRMFLRSVFHYPFVQLKCRRVTALVDASNIRSQRLVEHLGFVREGCLREGAAAEDVFVYGLLKRACRWLPVNQ